MPNRPTRFYSSRQEKTVAKAIGGRVTSNSGATKFDKGDVTTDKVLLECKTCTEPKKSFSIKKDWLKKNEEEAFAKGKQYSALVIDFGDSSEQFYIINERAFKQFLDSLDNQCI